MLALFKKWRNRSLAYQRVFLTDDGALNADAVVIFGDLKRFCHVDRSTVKVTAANTIDPLAMAMAEGRREVFMRMVQIMNLDESALSRLQEPNPSED